MEQLANLPPYALVAFGGTLALIVAVQRFGFLSGASSGQKGQSAATVAAVVVDSTELRKATVALESHTLVSNRLVSALEGVGKSVEGVERSIDALAQEADRVREELRIARELARRER
jgi:hypothetical protein